VAVQEMVSAASPQDLEDPVVEAAQVRMALHQLVLVVVALRCRDVLRNGE
jgi:hypothetical protein